MFVLDYKWDRSGWDRSGSVSLDKLTMMAASFLEAAAGGLPSGADVIKEKANVQTMEL